MTYRLESDSELTLANHCNHRLSCLHNKHINKTLRIMDLALTIQYLSLSKASVRSLPQWWFDLWWCNINKSVAGWCLGNIIWCFRLFGMPIMFLRRPPTFMILLSNVGFNVTNLLFWLTWLEENKSWSSCLNVSFCINSIIIFLFSNEVKMCQFKAKDSE